MKKVLFSISAVLLFTTGNALGETHYVLPGDKIQTAIDNTDDGDTVVVIGGEYPHDVTIDSKDIKFTKPFGDKVTINGDVNLRNLDKHFEFIDFHVRGDTSNAEAIIVNNCKDIVLSKILTRDITISESSALVLDTELSHLTLHGKKCSAKVVGCKISKELTSNDSSDLGHVIYQNHINRITTNRADQKVTIAYNKVSR